jgi:hypothetical protein
MHNRQPPPRRPRPVHNRRDAARPAARDRAICPQLIPDGLAALSYATTSTIRLPIDVAITEQSDGEQVRSLLRAELAGTGERTGFDPEDIDAKIVVSFTTSILHAPKP